MAHPADIQKPADVALYTFEVKIDGERYGGEIPARNWEAAQAAVSKFGGNVIGRLVETMDAQRSVCAICGGDITEDKEHPQPIEDDEFPDLIGD